MAKDKKKPSAEAQGLPEKIQQESTPSVFWEASLMTWRITAIFLFCYMCYQAVLIRLFAVKNYGKIIHEFDPWFNFRATEYLVENGYEKFSTWYDYQSWYPMGRPVGTTVYPGMMISSAAIFTILEQFEIHVSLNDVCVFVPAFFSILTCCFTFLLGYEVTGSANCGLVSMGLMALIPAHLMRSVAGGYDNESVAFAIIVSTFYFWVRSLRDKQSWRFGILAGLSYAYLACTWGAYIYVLNLIALHALALIVFGKYNWGVQSAYSCFYLVGTMGALQFPVVGWQPFDSLEQISGLIVFIIMQVTGIVLFLRDYFKMSQKQFSFFLFVFGAVVLGCVAVGVAHGVESGQLLPATARVKALFVKHTKTGNPLVDSVAEHRATPLDVYLSYFGFVYFCAPLGLLLSAFTLPYTPALLFFWLHLGTSMFFSLKMIRLVVLLAPPACIAAGSVLGRIFEWSFGVFSGMDQLVSKEKKNAPFIDLRGFNKGFKKMRFIRFVLAILGVVVCALLLAGFVAHCWTTAPKLSEPQIVLRGKTKEGKEVLVEDFLDGYNWLKENTPEDARILSWWDYGYQINGIANRTTLADGNTWNHEHIALIGKIMVTPESEAHRIAKHLSDYVLIWSGRWAGMMGDDLAKSVHMARIAGSVFSDIEAKDYYMINHRTQKVSPALSRSLLYQLHQFRFNPEVKKPLYFEEVFTTKNRAMRIYKVLLPDEESKEFISQHHTYPPALDETFSTATNYS